MTNDQYLIFSYFICAALSVALGTLAYLFLRRPFAAVADATSRTHLGSALKRLFPLGLLFPALLGFVSVSYWSCDRTSYEEIVQSRAYLVQKNQEQISSVLLSILAAVLIWDAVIVLVLKYAQNRRKEL
jgi:hypothetical protein